MVINVLLAHLEVDNKNGLSNLVIEILQINIAIFTAIAARLNCLYPNAKKIDFLKNLEQRPGCMFACSNQHTKFPAKLTIETV